MPNPISDKLKRTRFAPSPSGLLHVGNAYSALCCMDWARQHQAELLLRIEDIDHTRCKATYAQTMIDDLTWLGLKWPQPMRYQSQCLARYQHALARLQAMHLMYPCFCTRKDIQHEVLRMASAPHASDAISAYPGICKNLPPKQQQQRMQSEHFAWRLDIKKALAWIGLPLTWQDELGQQHPIHIDHDMVIGRKDIDFSYHLAVVTDDAAQGINHIIRGDDLRDSIGIHRLLQTLLALPEPIYQHHALLCNLDGQRLAKRTGAISLQSLRKIGVKAHDLRAFLAHLDTPVWPFSSNQPEEILRELGKMV